MVLTTLDSFLFFRQSPLPWIKGLKWGEYVGSPSTPDPVVCFSQPHGERFGSLLALPTRAICGLSRKFCLMMIYSKEQGRSSKVLPISAQRCKKRTKHTAPLNRSQLSHGCRL